MIPDDIFEHTIASRPSFEFRVLPDKTLTFFTVRVDFDRLPVVHSLTRSLAHSLDPRASLVVVVRQVNFLILAGVCAGGIVSIFFGAS